MVRMMRRHVFPVVFWHNGSNTLWYAIVAFDAGRDRGVAVVTNGGPGAEQAVNQTGDGGKRDSLVYSPERDSFACSGNVARVNSSGSCNNSTEVERATIRHE
jgi:hypothetical protein